MFRPRTAITLNMVSPNTPNIFITRYKNLSQNTVKMSNFLNTGSMAPTVAMDIMQVQESNALLTQIATTNTKELMNLFTQNSRMQ